MKVQSLYIIWVFSIAELYAEPLSIVTSNTKYSFDIEVARTPEELTQGLMFRKSIPQNGGMLFIYDENRQPRIWMKNTYVALDVLFIDRGGKIVKIHPHAQPHSLRIIQSDHEARFVLELLAGTAKKLGLLVGDRIEHPALVELQAPVEPTANRK